MAPLTVTVKLEGLPELVKRLESLELDLRKRILVDSVRKSLDKALIQAKANAAAVSKTGKPPWGAKGGEYKGKKHPGYLQNSFKIAKVRKSREAPGIIEVRLMNTAYTARWIEYGHWIVRGGSYKSGRGKRSKTFIGARPFMLPVFHSQKDYIISEVGKAIRRRLDRRGV